MSGRPFLNGEMMDVSTCSIRHKKKQPCKRAAFFSRGQPRRSFCRSSLVRSVSAFVHSSIDFWPHPLRELLDIDRADAGALQRDGERAIDDKRLLRNDIVCPRCDRCEREIVLWVTQRDRLGLIVVELKLHLKCLFHDSFSFPLVMRQLRASRSPNA